MCGQAELPPFKTNVPPYLRCGAAAFGVAAVAAGAVAAPAGAAAGAAAGGLVQALRPTGLRAASNIPPAKRRRVRRTDARSRYDEVDIWALPPNGEGCA